MAVATPGATPGGSGVLPQAGATPTGPRPASAGGTPTVFASRTPTRTPTRTPGPRPQVALVRGLGPLSLKLTGKEQVVQATLVVAVQDYSLPEQQPGWSLALTMDQFRVVGSPSRTLPRDAVTLLWASVNCTSGEGCTTPRNSIAYPLDVPAGAAVPFLRAAPGSGGGEYQITLTFAVTVPSNAYAGSYTTNIDVAIAGAR